jgi:cassette chromosome recombinase B
MEVTQMKEKIDIKAKTIKMDTGKGNTIKVTMSYGEQSTLEELLIAYLRQEIAGGSAA